MGGLGPRARRPPSRSCKLPALASRFEALRVLSSRLRQGRTGAESASARLELSGGKSFIFGVSGNHAAHHRQTRPCQGARPCGERGRAPQHHPHPVQRPARDGQERAEADRHRSRHGAGRDRAGCKAKGEGATTVPAHMFHDIVRKLPEGADIELARDGEQGRLTITSGPAQFSLQTLPADDFPRSASTISATASRCRPAT